MLRSSSPVAVASRWIIGCGARGNPLKPTGSGETKSEIKHQIKGGLNVIHDLKANKQNAIDFYRTAYLGNPAKAIELYVGDEYIQHNPLVGDGKAAFVEYFNEMAKDYPDKSIKFVRSLGEGDMVALHTHQTWPGNDEYVTMDFFRFDDNGKIIEHWDSIQRVPSESKNENTMY